MVRSRVLGLDLGVEQAALRDPAEVVANTEEVAGFEGADTAQLNPRQGVAKDGGGRERNGRADHDPEQPDAVIADGILGRQGQRHQDHPDQRRDQHDHLDAEVLGRGTPRPAEGEAEPDQQGDDRHERASRGDKGLEKIPEVTEFPGP